MSASVAQVKSLLAYARAEERPWCAAMIDPTLVGGDAMLAEIAGVSVDALERCRHNLGLQHNDLAARRRARIARVAGNRETYEVLMGAPMSGKVLTVELLVRGKRLRVSLPPTTDSALLLLEIFVDDTYQMEAPEVPVIYDVGANVGMAALDLHLRHPHARLVCVEPVPSNVELLRRNLADNGVEAEVLACAVAEKPGTATLHVDDDAHTLASTAATLGWGARPRKAVTVEARTFAELLTAEHFGLKLDAEGAEHLLVGHPELLKRAAWMVGEIHVGEGVVPWERRHALEEVLRRTHDVEVGAAEVFGATLTRAVRARSR